MDKINQVPAVTESQVLVESRHVDLALYDDSIGDGVEQIDVQLALYHGTGQISGMSDQRNPDDTIAIVFFAMALNAGYRIEQASSFHRDFVRRDGVLRYGWVYTGNICRHSLDRDRARGNGQGFFHWLIGSLDFHETDPLDLDYIIEPKGDDGRYSRQCNSNREQYFVSGMDRFHSFCASTGFTDSAPAVVRALIALSCNSTGQLKKTAIFPSLTSGT